MRLLPGKSYQVGRNPDCDLALSDPTVSRRHARLTWDGDSLIIEDAGSSNGSFLNGARVEKARLKPGDSLRFGRLEFTYLVRQSEAAAEDALSPSDTLVLEGKLRELAQGLADPALGKRFEDLLEILAAKKRDLAELVYRDGLTGLYNRRYFDESVSAEWKRLARYKRPLSIIMVDIDHFKHVNDAHGHQKGDSVLRSIAGIIMDNIRANDIPCRYGGEEIVIILPETDLAQAALTAEKLRSLIEVQLPDVEGIPVTASFGLSHGEPGRAASQSAADLVKTADSALYRAKESGRNCVRGA